MFWIALAVSISVPQPLNRQAWYSPDDVPRELLPNSGVGVVRFRIVVTPDGKIQGCDTEYSSTGAKLGSYTCNLLRRRARFRPAIGPAGNPTYGVYRSWAIWAENPNNGSYSQPIDAEFTVNRLPPNISSPASVGILFAADENGHLSSCSGERPNENPQLATLACTLMVQGYEPIPVRDADGHAVLSVQDALVAFKTN